MFARVTEVTYVCPFILINDTALVAWREGERGIVKKIGRKSFNVSCCTRVSYSLLVKKLVGRGRKKKNEKRLDFSVAI